MSSPAQKPATYEDLLRVPAHLVAELIAGEIYTQPRPASPHAYAISELHTDVGSAFHRGRGGPGGWVIIFEPELHLGSDVLVPDLAGWRRERMPQVPSVPYFELAPDWVCEAISPSTAARDRTLKLDVYRRERVRHLWFLDPDARTLEVMRLDGDGYRIASTHAEDAKIRAEPFDAIELDLALLWLPEPPDGRSSGQPGG